MEDEEKLVFDLESTFEDAPIRSRYDVVCKHWLRALCKKNTECDYLHEYVLSKMPECWFYTNYGECTNEGCEFRHIDPDQKTSLCAWYQRGFCKHGTRCRREHVTTKMCYNYWLGFCPHGPSCPFQHPSFDVIEEEVAKEKARTNTRPNPNIVCHRCGETGHKMAQCPQANPNEEDRRRRMGGGGGRGGRRDNDGEPGRSQSSVICFNCREPGHVASFCPKAKMPQPNPHAQGPAMFPPGHGAFPPHNAYNMGGGAPMLMPPHGFPYNMPPP